MKKTNIYDLAYTDLNIYLEKNIKNYERLRNYDFGLNDRTNISNLSKYISHRILNEFELIKNVLSKYKLNEVEKFIQEVFWRIYWKGWLELRPDGFEGEFKISHLVFFHYLLKIFSET